MDFNYSHKVLAKIKKKENLNEQEMRNIEFGLKLIEVYDLMLDEGLGLSDTDEFKFKFKYERR